MSDRRRGLGRGLGALIPSAPAGERPVDVFFGEARRVPSALDVRWPSPVGEPAPAEPAEVGPDPDGVPDRPTGTPGGTEDGDQEGVARARDAADELPGRTADGSAGESTGGEPAGLEDAGPAAPESPSDLVPVPGVHLAEVPVDRIVPNPRQPRQVFDEAELAELAASIREIGVLQPVVVRAAGNDEAGPRFELVMGERRWRASREAGLATVPALVRDTQDDAMLRDALLENLHRSELNPLEEAAAYQQLLDDFGCTHDELAGRLGRSRPQISNTLRLLRLPPTVQRRVAAGVLSAGHARALLGLDDPAAMERLAQRVVAEGLSVRATEEAVALGGDGAGPVRRRSPRMGDRHEGLDALAARLSDRFDTRVQVALGRRKGRLTVEFASVEDLERIVALIAPEEPAASAS
jgi:ParB family transcriptional regulator, chromosome partitioning protein